MMSSSISTSDQLQVISLWEAGEINATFQDQPEEVAFLQSGLKVIRNVSQPSLTVYLPDPAIANGTAVIVCPGGAYHFLAFEHLNDPHQMETLVAPLFPLITADGCQAIRLVRARAAEWGIAPDRIGIMGFSAGGMLPLSVALQFDSSSCPDFAAPIYGAPPPDAPIPSNAPPLFLLCAADDDMASAVSTRFYSAWRAASHPVELHIYANGGHGFGMHEQGLPSDGWIDRFAEWLQAQGLLPEAN
jgi:dienelactone hydrolase